MRSTVLSAISPPVIVQLNLATVAQQIAAEHQACSTAGRQSLSHAMRCGDLLLQAKAECPHGTWQTWLADNFDGSKLYKHIGCESFDEYCIGQHNLDPGLLYFGIDLLDELRGAKQ